MEENHNIKTENPATYLEADESILDSIEFIRILYIIKKSVWWIVLFFLLAIGLVYLYMRYTKPIYKSTSLLKLEMVETSNDFGLNNKLGNENNLFGEIEFIQSQIILKEVINTLNDLHISYYNVGTVNDEERFENSPFKVLFAEGKEKEIIDKVIYIKLINRNSFEYWINDENEKVIANYDSKIQLDNAEFWIERTAFYNSKIEGETFYFTINSYGKLRRYLTKNLSAIAVNRNANTIEIAFTDHNKRKAAAIVSTVDTVYLKKTVEQKQLENLRSIQYIDAQLSLTKLSLDSSEALIENFLLRNNITSVDQKQNKVLETLEKIREEKTKIQEELTSLRAINNAVQKNNSDIVDDIYAFEIKNEGLNKLLNTYEEALIEFDKIKKTNKPSTIVYQNIANEIESITTKLNLRIKKQFENLNAKLVHFDRKLIELNKELTVFPELRSTYNRLISDYSSYERLYTSLREKKIEYGIAKAGITPNFQILTEASESNVPIFPKRFQVIAIGFAIATAISVLFLFVRYLLYNTIISLKELEKLTSIPIVGTIPNHKHKNPFSTLVVHEAPKSPLSESLRSIRTNLDFFGIEKQTTKVICFTSTISGEGKTFMSVNLAGILAMSDFKVVVLDLDMRKPKIHKAFLTENIQGMSELLIGKTVLKNCIRNSELENLDFITSGNIPPNPSELIMRDEFDELIEELSKDYHFIFIDSPPAGLVTDAHILMKKCDVPIYVIKAGYSSRSVTKRINRLYQANQYPNFSLALNSVQHQESYKSGYGGYGYGYGYYQKSSKKEKGFFSKLFKK